MREAMWTRALVVACALLGGCSAAPSPSDASRDAAMGEDASARDVATRDAVVADAAVDAADAAPVDVASGEDAPADEGADGSVDVSGDTPVDAIEDVPTDALADAPADAPPDAPSDTNAADSSDADAAPADAACTTVCPPFTWSPGAWSVCSAACGTGAQMRVVQCLDAHGAAVDELRCDAATRPPAMQPCMIAACGTWDLGPFSVCSVACGPGTETRSIRCVGATGDTLPDSSCNPATRPVESIPCTGVACTGTWSTGPFGTCSVWCGGGTETRSVTCVDSTGATVPDSACNAATRPVESISCNTNPCPTYTWSTGPWSTCSVWCGGGTETRSLTCVDSADTPVADALCDAATRPPTMQVCNTNPCP